MLQATADGLKIFVRNYVNGDVTVQCYVDFVRKLFVNDRIWVCPRATQYWINTVDGYLTADVPGEDRPLTCAYIVPLDTNVVCADLAAVATYLSGTNPATFVVEDVWVAGRYTYLDLL